MVYNRSKYILLPEPELTFSYVQPTYKSLSPLEGLKNWGPYDASIPGFILRPSNPIRIALISPSTKVHTIKGYLQSLMKENKLTKPHEYLRDYKGFKEIYGLNVDISDQLIITVNPKEIVHCKNGEHPEITFLELIKSKPKMLSAKREQFDLIVLFITSEMKEFLEIKSENYSFDFHDQLKAYSAPSNLRLQLIREERIPKQADVNDTIRKLWWLSSAIYTKTGGIPYKLADISGKTAFIGLAYGIKHGNTANRIVLGSSQVFNERGEGIRFHLFPIENPLWEKIGVKRKNPYMNSEDARRLFTIIRQDYQTINGELPSRVVVHKSTPFKSEEIEGIVQALEGINNIELLTINQNTLHRAIQGEIRSGKQEVSNFPIKRGTVLPLDSYSFLLWTCGDLDGVDPTGRHFYQERRYIPEPIVVTRYLGKDCIETVAVDILKLTKMNWNNLQIYNRLPVTIEFAHSISDIVKQLESYSNVPKDFRYYI